MTPIEIAEKLTEYANKHRMMFGMTPESDLIIAAAKALQASVQSDVEPTTEANKPRRTKKEV